MCYVTVDNEGTIYCVWNDGRKGSGSDIYFSKSIDNGQNFTSNVAVNTIISSDSKMRCGAKVAVFGSNVYLGWREGDWQDGKVLLAKSTDGGASFGAEKVMFTDGVSSPSLYVNSIGEIYYACPQFAGDQNGIFCKKSDDGGETFPVTEFLSGVNADARYPSIFVDNDDILYAVWTDNRSGNKDVFFAKGTITITDIADNAAGVPTRFELNQNYPNPFNPVTKISFSITSREKVTLKIFDLMGSEVQTLINSHFEAGYHVIEFDGSKLTSGVYFYRLTAGNFVSTKKLMLLK